MHDLEVLARRRTIPLAYVDTIEEPSYPEGELSWQALQSLARAAQRR
jgi:hypothetical protein